MYLSCTLQPIYLSYTLQRIYIPYTLQPKNFSYPQPMYILNLSNRADICQRSYRERKDLYEERQGEGERHRYTCHTCGIVRISVNGPTERERERGGKGARERERCVCTATHCNTLQHTATHCNTLQHTAKRKIGKKRDKERERDTEIQVIPVESCGYLSMFLLPLQTAKM